MKFKDVMKKCFGKEKNDRWHAVAMLTLYAIFFIVAYLVLTIGSTGVDNTNPQPTPKETNVVINYNYSYTINYDDNVEVYIGKKYGNKEKYTLIKDGNNTEYAIINNKNYKLENGNYIETIEVNNYIKYCNKDKILNLIDYNLCTKENNIYKCDIDSKTLSNTFNDQINNNDNELNTIYIEKENDIVKSIKLNLDNYISGLSDINQTLKININFTDIGTTNDFEIKLP